jgi:hypothetical protein
MAEDRSHSNECGRQSFEQGPAQVTCRHTEFDSACLLSMTVETSSVETLLAYTKVKLAALMVEMLVFSSRIRLLASGLKMTVVLLLAL